VGFGSVAQHADRLIGFLSLTPIQPGGREDLEEGHRNLGIQGIPLMPRYTGFYPQDRKLDGSMGCRFCGIGERL
jgi:predicted TIM-barrel fold metal-dependent hydrolase